MFQALRLTGAWDKLTDNSRTDDPDSATPTQSMLVTQGKRHENLRRELDGTDGEHIQSSTQGKQPENLRREQDEWNQVLIQATTQRKKHKHLRREQDGQNLPRSQNSTQGKGAGNLRRELGGRVRRDSWKATAV